MPNIHCREARRREEHTAVKSTPQRATALLCVALSTVLTLTACSSDQKAQVAINASSSPAIAGTITVLAAASLTQSFTALGKKFEASHPGVSVKFSFGGSSTLATNINNGAPADVYASASATSMDQVLAKGNADTSKAFAKNVLEIATPPANPARITGLGDLTKPGIKVDLCDVKQPCGSAATKLFANAKLSVTPVSYEADVKAVLAKVTTGEVDAGLVYASDVKAAGARVHGVTIPASIAASTTYPIATLKNSGNAATAAAFVAFVLSDAGTEQLVTDGFSKP